MKVFPFTVRYLYVDFREINDNFNVMQNFCMDVEESEGLQEVEDLEMNMDKEEEVSPFRIDIGEFSRDFYFPDILMPNPQMIWEYRDELKARVYIKFVECLYGWEPIDDEVKWWIESQSLSRTHSCNFLLINIEQEMVQMGHQALELPTDADQYPLVESKALGMTLLLNEARQIENAYSDVCISSNQTISHVVCGKGSTTTLMLFFNISLP